VSVFFAVAALGVSAAGLVGIVGFVVARRTREMAIRIAIGAPSRTVIRLVTQESTLAAAAGAAMGLAAAWWLSRTIASLLYGIRPADPIAFALAAALVVFMVTVAAWLPARRAVRLSPTVALRVE
jgi:ABC-type antimicrobial peptide transport system permease subunit